MGAFIRMVTAAQVRHCPIYGRAPGVIGQQSLMLPFDKEEGSGSGLGRQKKVQDILLFSSARCSAVVWEARSFRQMIASAVQ